MSDTALTEAAADQPARPEEKLGSLRDIVGVHLRLAHNALFRHFMDTLAHVDLTPKQTSVLWLIGELPGIAQIDLAARLDMDRASMMTIIDRLESRDLVARSRSKLDRRRQDLHLTPTGVTVLAEARAAVSRHEAWLKDRLGSPADVTNFVEQLRRIYGQA